MVTPDRRASVLGALRDQEAVAARGEERASELEHFLVELSTLGVDTAQELSSVLGVRDDDALPEECKGTSRDSGNRSSLGAVLERENAKLLPIEEREMPGAGAVGPPHETPPGRSEAEGELPPARKFRVS